MMSDTCGTSSPRAQTSVEMSTRLRKGEVTGGGRANGVSTGRRWSGSGHGITGQRNGREKAKSTQEVPLPRNHE